MRKNTWYKKNRKKGILATRRWQVNNPDKFKKTQKKWIKDHPDYFKTWQREHPEKAIKWKKNNPLSLKESQKLYKKKNKNNTQFILKNKARRRAHYYISIKGVLCFKCKKEQAIHRHHIDYSKPLKVQLLCNKCHRGIHNEK